MSRAFPTQFSKYVGAGAITLVVNLIILFMLTDLFRVYYVFSAILAFLLAMSLGYYIDGKWAFRGSQKKRGYAKYITVSVAILLIDLTTLFVLVEKFHVWYMFSQAIAFISSGILGFMLHKHWTFRVWEDF